MARQDLLALAADDLIALSNRGIVKRARREVDAGETPAEIDEDAAGNIVTRWSDGAVCHLAVGALLSDDACTCPATTVCRHLIGTILAYQRKTAKSIQSPGEESTAWDPGSIPDDSFAACWNSRQMASARQVFDSGLVIELHRGPRPRARFHDVAHCIRFMVPGDARYTRCDCADPAPCQHVLLAIWAFRLLPADRASGLVTTAHDTSAIPVTALAEIDRVLEELIDCGLASLPDPFVRRLERLEQDCRHSDLLWLAGILSDLLLLRQQYQAHDARFNPAQAAALIGELAIRADAARAPEHSVPKTFICGSSAERNAAMRYSRLIGLGTAVEQQRGSVVVTAYFQDAASGIVVALPRRFADPQAGEVSRPFAALGRTVVLKSSSLGDVGTGQIVIRGGKKTADGELHVGRAGAAVSPQDYRWESLRPPVLASGFADLLADQVLRPHPCLRPRRLTEDVSVCPVSVVEDAHFDVREQSVVARLRDADGQVARLVHPFRSRGCIGAEALLYHLGNSKLLFVSGKTRVDSTGLVISPAGLVFERGTDRWMLQPWICDDTPPRAARIAQGVQTAEMSPTRRHLGELLDLLGEVAVLGRTRVPQRMWQDLRAQSTALGLVHFPTHIAPESVLTLSALVVYAMSDPAMDQQQ